MDFPLTTPYHTKLSPSVCCILHPLKSSRQIYHQSNLSYLRGGRVKLHIYGWANWGRLIYLCLKAPLFPIKGEMPLCTPGPNTSTNFPGYQHKRQNTEKHCKDTYTCP